MKTATSVKGVETANSVKRMKTASADLPMLLLQRQMESTSQTQDTFEPTVICASSDESQIMDDVVATRVSSPDPGSDWPAFCNDDGVDVMRYFSNAL